MFMGTGSDVGKTLVVAGLCRAFANRGLRVAPFKPQNMSNNAAVTADGGEIGRAQATQAIACRVEPTTDMNPVLLKPQADRTSQLIVHGTVRGTLGSGNFRAARGALLGDVLESYRRLRTQCDVVVVEGAGSPAEINLRGGDIANMGFARAAGVPVLLVGDIDRGVPFARAFRATQHGIRVSSRIDPRDHGADRIDVRRFQQDWEFFAFRGDEAASGELDARLVALPALEVRTADERAVDAGRGDFEVVGPVDRILDVEGRRDIARDGLAILDIHRPVGPLGHDLHGHAVQRRDLDAHEAVAEALDHRLDDMRDAGLEPGLGDDARFCFRRFRQALVLERPKTEKSGPGGSTLQTTDRFEIELTPI